MEVTLDKRYPLPVGIDPAWVVLSDIRATAACMPGAAITEQIDATHYKGTVRSKVGPAVMTFNGDIEVLGIDAATRTLQMLGKGSDRGGSSASMNLTAHVEAGDTPASSVLVGKATVSVSGKLAQLGQRLIVPVSDAMLGQFALNFSTAVAAVGAPVIAATPTPGGAVESGAPITAASAPAPTPAPAKELNALSLLWAAFKVWISGIFGKRA